MTPINVFHRLLLTLKLFIQAIRMPLLSAAAGFLLIDAAWLLFAIATVFTLNTFFRPNIKMIFQARWFDVLAISLMAFQSLYAFILGMAYASGRQPEFPQISAIILTSLIITFLYQLTKRYPTGDVNARF